MDARPIDADNHYYEPLDAFTRHLDKAYRHRGVRPVQDGKRVQLLIGGRVNQFIPNPTFDPIIVPGCLDPLFRGQIPEGVDPRSLMQVEPLRAEYRDRDRRLEVMDEQARRRLWFPTLGAGRYALRDDSTPLCHLRLHRWSRGWASTTTPHHCRPHAVARRSRRGGAEVDSIFERGARIVHVPPPRARPNGSTPLCDKRTTRVGRWPSFGARRLPPGTAATGRFASAGRNATFGFGNSDALGQWSCPTVRSRHGRSLSSRGVQAPPPLRIADRDVSDGLHVLANRLRKQANQTPWVFAEIRRHLRRHVW